MRYGWRGFTPLLEQEFDDCDDVSLCERIRLRGTVEVSTIGFISDCRKPVIDWPLYHYPVQSSTMEREINYVVPAPPVPPIRVLEETTYAGMTPLQLTKFLETPWDGSYANAA